MNFYRKGIKKLALKGEGRGDDLGKKSRLGEANREIRRIKLGERMRNM
jgi:hypothetical protein